MRLVGVLAVLVLLIHVFWILWVVLGWILTCSRPSLRWFHIGSLLWGILMEVGPWPCPLTIAEQWLQRRAGSAEYEGSFLFITSKLSSILMSRRRCSRRSVLACAL